MNAQDPNAILLERVAERLGADLRETMVFVGGAIAGLLVTDSAMPAIRPTDDVDLIFEALALADYHRLEPILRNKGFEPDMASDAPICRWRVAGIAVDVMPTLPDVLGFSNPWYPLAVTTAQRVRLPGGLEIRLLTAPVFLATKLEAFAGRGNDDFLFSHDLGDLLAVVDGRDSLLDECRASPPKLRAFLAGRIGDLLAQSRFLDALPGHLPGDAASQERLPDLEAKLGAIAALDAGSTP